MVSRASFAVAASLRVAGQRRAASVAARDPWLASVRARIACRSALGLGTAASASSKCAAAPS